ncbi:MAG: H-NS histone family protein [Pseudomonadota bacterium]
MSATLDDLLSSLSLQELLAAREKIEERIVRVQRSEHNAARKKILELARLHGIDVSFSEGEEASKKSKLPPKYRNPENQKQTWPGHGKKPAWLEGLLAKGHKVDEFLIQP